MSETIWNFFFYNLKFFFFNYLKFVGHFCFCFNRRQMSGTERRGSTPFLKFVVGGCQQCASGNIIEWVSLMNVLPIWLTGTIFSKNWRSKRLLMATRPTFNAADKHLFYL